MATGRADRASVGCDLVDKGSLCGAGNVQLNGKKLNMIVRLVSEVEQLRHLTLYNNLLESGMSHCNPSSFER